MSCTVKVCAIALSGDPFSVSNGLLTPTLKLRRSVARERFSAIADRVYTNFSQTIAEKSAREKEKLALKL